MHFLFRLVRKKEMLYEHFFPISLFNMPPMDPKNQGEMKLNITHLVSVYADFNLLSENINTI
jgi:hypothetical protein